MLVRVVIYSLGSATILDGQVVYLLLLKVILNV